MGLHLPQGAAWHVPRTIVRVHPTQWDVGGPHPMGRGWTPLTPSGTASMAQVPRTVERVHWERTYTYRDVRKEVPKVCHLEGPFLT